MSPEPSKKSNLNMGQSPISSGPKIASICSRFVFPFLGFDRNLSLDIFPFPRGLNQMEDVGS